MRMEVNNETISSEDSNHEGSKIVEDSSAPYDDNHTNDEDSKEGSKEVITAGNEVFIFVIPNGLYISMICVFCAAFLVRTLIVLEGKCINSRPNDENV